MTDIINHANSILPFSISPWEALTRACSLYDAFVDFDKEKNRAYVEWEGEDVRVSLTTGDEWELD